MTPVEELQQALTASLPHITVTEKPGARIDAACATCGQGIDVPPKFGPIPQDVLLAEWIKQHAHRDRKARR